MKNIIILPFTLFLLFFSSTIFAFFCPTNFQQINLGDTMVKVLELCGKPETQISKPKEEPVPQEWIYYLPQTVSNSMNNTVQGTLKTTVSFDAAGNAINLSVNGIGVGGTDICGTNIQLGSNIKEVEKACGKPLMINKASPPDIPEGLLAPTKNEITEFIYRTNPPISLIFENAVLVERR